MRVVCATIPGGGHGFPMLSVARAFAARGHDVWFLSGPAHEGDAARAGARFVALPDVPGSPLDDLRPFDDAAATAERVLTPLRAIAPDALVHDVISIGPALAAEMLRVPVATLVIHPLHTPSRDLAPFGYGDPPGPWPLGPLFEAWMRHGKRKDLEGARDDLNRARTRLGLPPTDRLEGQLSPDLLLVATLPSLELSRRDWPPEAHVVGPCLWDVGGATEFEPPPGDGPLVLVAPSTAWDRDPLLGWTAEAVARLGVRAVFAAGKGAMPTALPPGCIAAPDVPHAAILPHAAAIVCHGGHGTVVRALGAGVPCVVVPGHGDQKENAYRIERAGAGLRVRRPGARRIAESLGRVLSDPSFRGRAGALRDEAATLDGPARSAELVESLAARRRAYA